MTLERLPYIYYLLCFQKDTAGVRALIDSGSKFIAMIPAYASRLGLQACHTSVRAKKINGYTFQTFGMVFDSFQVKDKLGRDRFFQETFLLADTSMKVVLNMLFLTLSNADIQFAERELT